MAKKTFNLNDSFNPAMQFISTPATEEPAEAPEGYKVNPLYIEKKSKRLQLLIQPSLYEKLSNRACKDGQSINNTIHQILEKELKGD